MGFIDDIRARRQAQKDAELLAEEKLYEHVANEIESDKILRGLWIKASTTATSSDQEDIQREYARLRVEHLRAEGRLFQQFVKEASEAVEENEPEPQIKSQAKTPYEPPELVGSQAALAFLGVVVAFVVVAFVLVAALT